MSMADRHLLTESGVSACGVSGNPDGGAMTVAAELVSCTECVTLHEERLALIEVMAGVKGVACTEAMLNETLMADAVLAAGFRLNRKIEGSDG